MKELPKEPFFDVAYFLGKIDEIRENEATEIVNFRKKIFPATPGKLKIFDEMDYLDRRMLIAVENLSEEDLIILCKHAKKAGDFGFHDLGTILSTLAF